VSKQAGDIRTGAVEWRRDKPGGCPPIGQAVSSMEATRVRSAASARNVGTRVLILRWTSNGVRGERECPWRRKPPGVECRCGMRWRTGS
jgi:hypothetical protein